jgi:cytidylate kinase
VRARIAIDGPAGSGKSTVSRMLAQRLGLRHIDTGAMYRAVTLKAQRAGVGPGDGKALRSLAEASDIDLGPDGAVFLDGADVTSEIRSAEVTAEVSEVAAHPGVREVLVEIQRRLAQGGGVAEGRDIGTVVLPDADLKVFLTASREERARRRLADETDGAYEAAYGGAYEGRGRGSGLAEVLADIDRRDRLDSEREASPLKVAPDALVIDTTSKTPAETVDEIIMKASEADRTL